MWEYGELSQQLGAHVALAKDLGSIPMHEGCDSQPFIAPFSGDVTPSSDLWRLQTHNILMEAHKHENIFMQAKHSHLKQINPINNFKK